MILKRQTVWLLTMLSLIIVLSVYYISMDRVQDPQTAVTDIEETTNDESMEEELEFEWVDGDDITFVELDDVEDVLGDAGLSEQMNTDEMFDTIRLQRQDARGRLNEEYTNVIVSAETDPEIQVEALEKIENLQAMSQQEEMVETIIRSKGYEDALVMTEDNQVNIYVKSNELTTEQVTEINQLAYEHLGIESIRVGFHAGD
ncbi:SpoIIIAH-like family protein [Salipaludibacillus agaradhaerens]|uniref:SpoIIIAH-like family protein n=1 Tax=Salipaludibacillus agaradhaerens TaxID=76935 RepID=A0A9Q4B274_SALAG|nr:SpoIIIAH-like family protein [Salipaludibacillus agaradhaerens]MCR6096672.1 SpoIIIAH-like family protein [Salipaludibacillus agaradhaerens]MCR6113769.1 SpoIIIAH-like family protein [Salipaludibacillus agaradhaerens]